MKCSNAKPSQRSLDFKAGISDETPGTLVAAGRSASAPIIELDDSGEEMEICVPNIFASGEVKSAQSDENGRRCNQISLLASSSKRKLDYSSSSDDSDSDLPGVDRLIASLDKRIRLWTSEHEMTTAFLHNEGLRMSAVCALYRQLNCNVKSATSCLLIKDHVEQSDALSIARNIRRLGKFLTDGDPQGKLNKSVEELKHYDPEGPKKCYAISLEYTKQLYKIYKNRQDPFFPPY